MRTALLLALLMAVNAAATSAQPGPPGDPAGGTGSIAGEVVSALDGSPVAGARITALAPATAWSKTAVETGVDGTFVIDSLGAGSWLLVADAPGFVPEYFDGARDEWTARAIPLAEGEAVAGIVFTLDRGARVSGRVEDTDGQPVEGVFVWVYEPGASGGADSTGTGGGGDPTGSGGGADSTGTGGGIGPDGTVGSDSGGDHQGASSSGWTVTGPDGTYAVDGLPAGTYVARAESRSGWGYSVLWYDQAHDESLATPIEIAAGAEVQGIDFVLPVSTGSGTLTGRVTASDGHPLEGVFVQAERSGTGGEPVCCYFPAYAYTDTDGFWEIADVPAGEYLVSAMTWGRWSTVVQWFPGSETRAGATPVPVARDERVANVDFVLLIEGGTSSIEGRVIDTAGSPLAGAFVTVQSMDDGREPRGAGTVQAWAVADSVGAWIVEGLPSGTYSLYASWWDSDRFGQVWYDGAAEPLLATPVELPDGAALAGFDLVIDPQYLFGGVWGVVTDAETGAPVERAFVQMRPLSADLTFAPIRRQDFHAVTDRDGTFSLDGLPIGRYLLSAHTDGGFAYFGGGWVPEEATAVEVAGGSLAEASFSVPRRDEGTGRIEGRVAIDFPVGWADSLHADVAEPPRIAVVEARPTVTAQVWPDSERFHATVVGEDGTYALSGLPAGEYHVSAYAPDFMPEYYDDAYDPGLAAAVGVDGLTPAGGIDFLLTPSMYMTADGGVPGPGTTLGGRVRDENGDPVGGATVYLMDSDGNAVASTSTAPDGTWALHGVSRGHYRVMVTKEGYAASFNDEARNFVEAPMVENAGSGAEINVTLRSATSTGRDTPADAPRAFKLRGNYPNPFNPVTTLVVDLAQPAEVRVEVFDLLGRHVMDVAAGRFEAGTAYVPVDAGTLPSGPYFYRVTARSATGTNRSTGRMLLAK